MDLLNNLLWVCLGISLSKGLIEPALGNVVQRGVLRWVPKILNTLDPVLPQWLNIYTEDELREKVLAVIYNEVAPKETLTAQKAEQILAEVVKSYDFLVNARKLELE